MNAMRLWLVGCWFGLSLMAYGGDYSYYQEWNQTDKYRVDFHPDSPKSNSGIFTVHHGQGHDYVIESPFPKDYIRTGASDLSNQCWHPEKPAFVVMGSFGLWVFALKDNHFRLVLLPRSVDKTLVPVGWQGDQIYLEPKGDNAPPYPAHVTLTLKSKSNGAWYLEKTPRGAGSESIKGGRSPDGRYEIRMVTPPHANVTREWNLDLLEIRSGRTLATISAGGKHTGPDSINWHPRLPVFTVTTYYQTRTYLTVYAWRKSGLELLWPTPATYPAYQEDLLKAQAENFEFEKWQDNDLWVHESLWTDDSAANGTVKLRYIDRPGTPMKVLSTVKWIDRPPAKSAN